MNLKMMRLKVMKIREWMILPTNLMYVDTRLEDPTQTGKEIVQGEGADVEMIDTQQGNENLETTQEQCESRQKTKTKKKPLTADQTRGLRREKRTKMPDRNPLSKKRKDSTSAHLKAPKSQNQNLLECLLFNQGTSFEISYWGHLTLGKTRTPSNAYARASIKRRCNSFNSVFCITCDMSKEGDFPRLHINDIEDMLLLVVHNRLTNLSGDNVADFAIVLRMFTKSLVIQKRVEDLQLGVESYQNKINITKPDSLPRPILTQRRSLATPP
ncbi:hypothetical protein Tco_0667303 [Tanacetum coccineum]